MRRPERWPVLIIKKSLVPLSNHFRAFWINEHSFMPITIQKWKRTEPKQLKRNKRCCRKEKNILKKHCISLNSRKNQQGVDKISFICISAHSRQCFYWINRNPWKRRQVNHEISFISINIFKVWYTDWNAGKSEKSWLASHEVSFIGIKIKY